MTADFGAVCGSCDMLENLDHCFGHRDVKSPGDATQTYDKGIKVKESAYLKSGLDVIPVARISHERAETAHNQILS
jgi:hypothetical protein